jgi:hypothetical protein
MMILKMGTQEHVKEDRLPSLFIGSAMESLDISYAIQENLARDAECTVWDQDIFAPSDYGLDAILDALRNLDFGIFVFTPDDIIHVRGKEYQVTRDNVVFELGLFIARLGKERNFLVVPSDQEKLKLPTDLLGLNVVTYLSKRHKINLRAALGPACNKIRAGIKKRGPLAGAIPDTSTQAQFTEEQYTEEDKLALLEDWLWLNWKRLDFGYLIRYSEVDAALGLPFGTAKQYLEAIALALGYEVKTKGSQVIRFSPALHNE